MSGRRIAMADGFLIGPLDDLDQVRLAGTYCARCNETSLGTNACCPNCGANDTSLLPLDATGSLLTFSVIRHRPPGDFRGADPFQPTGIALVGFRQGLAVVGLVEGPIEALEIGLGMRVSPLILYRNAEGDDVVSFRFEPLENVQ